MYTTKTFTPPQEIYQLAKQYPRWKEAVKVLYPAMLEAFANQFRLDIATQPQELVRIARDYCLMDITQKIYSEVHGLEQDATTDNIIDSEKSELLQAS